MTEVGEFVQLGERIPLRGTPDMPAVGQAVHAFLAADDLAWDDQRRR